MSSTLCSLNPSKTECLLLGLPQQLSKHSDPISHLPKNVTMPAVHPAPNLGVIFDSHLTFSDILNTFLLFLNHTFVILVISDAFETLLIILQPVLLLLLSFILNLTIAILLY
jgi:hypothetical protein